MASRHRLRPGPFTRGLGVKRGQVIFLVKFFGVLVALYLLVAWNPVNDHVVVPITAGIARTAGRLLRAMGQDVAVTGTTIASSRFGVNINNGCNGLEAVILLVAAMAAFPASMRARLLGLLITAAGVQLLNQVRIISLYLIGAYHPSLFATFHTAIWQVAVVLAAIVMFLLWSARVAPGRLANSP
jgi:exosortase H (IPTLxxWG-CTERM-specific)